MRKTAWKSGRVGWLDEENHFIEEENTMFFQGSEEEESLEELERQLREKALRSMRAKMGGTPTNGDRTKAAAAPADGSSSGD